MIKTLFGRASLIIIGTILVFLLALVAIANHYIISPVAKKNSEHLASLILLSAKTYVALPSTTRDNFVNELSDHHQLFLGTGKESLTTPKNVQPHLNVIENILSEHSAEDVNISPETHNPDLHWVDLNIAQETVRIGFNQQRIGGILSHLSIDLALILILITILSSMLLTRKITKPIQNLSAAAKIIGAGGVPEPLNEEGLKELADTARAFNKMSTDVKNLLENRTILLSGISHDLRTPLTRMGMALEMLPDSVDEELKSELNNSIANMELIIQEYMQLAKGLEEGDLETINVGDLMADIIDELNPKKTQIITFDGDSSCTFNTYKTALHRVLSNLIKNALRYGLDKPVSLSWQQKNDELILSVADQGLGIPASYREKIFRPFYRLESSRNRENGGTGLGLAIVDQIITKRNWHIDITDNEPTGTKITLKI
jgi:two-component system osmolarity sensor histidine kinase EnvZ